MKKATTFEMSVRAIAALKDRKGASTQAMKKWIHSNYPGTEYAGFPQVFKKALAKGLAGDVMCAGASSMRFKLTANGKKTLIAWDKPPKKKSKKKSSKKAK